MGLGRTSGCTYLVGNSGIVPLLWRRISMVSSPRSCAGGTEGSELGLGSRRGLGCGLVVFGVDGEVDDAAFAGGHGAELVGGAGAADFFGGHRRGGAQFLDAERALILAVEG